MVNSDDLLDRMLSICNDRNLLTDYRDDLVVHDRKILTDLSSWPLFAWMVGETFSDVIPIGLHRHSDVNLSAIIDVRSAGVRFAAIIDRTKAANPIQQVTGDQLRCRANAARCVDRIDTVLVHPEMGRLGYLSFRFEYVSGRGAYRCIYGYSSQTGRPAACNTLGAQIAPYWVLAEAQRQKGLWCSVIEDVEPPRVAA